MTLKSKSDFFPKDTNQWLQKIARPELEPNCGSLIFGISKGGAPTFFYARKDESDELY